MRQVTVTVGAVAASPVIPLDTYINPFSVGLTARINGGGTLTYAAQYTSDDIFAAGYDPSAGNWINSSTVTGSASTDGTLTEPVRAVRLNVSAHTSGSVTLTVTQSGMAGRG